MAKIPLPERGQPIDVSYIYQITNAVNSLAEKVNTTSYNYLTVDTPASGKQNAKVSDSRIIGATVSVQPNSSQTAGSTIPFSYSYSGNFKYTPIATATVINAGLTPAGDSATAVLTSVDANGLQGLVRFDRAGNVTVNVNLMIIGVPN